MTKTGFLLLSKEYWTQHARALEQFSPDQTFLECSFADGAFPGYIAVIPTLASGGHLEGTLQIPLSAVTMIFAGDSLPVGFHATLSKRDTP